MTDTVECLGVVVWSSKEVLALQELLYPVWITPLDDLESKKGAASWGIIMLPNPYPMFMAWSGPAEFSFQIFKAILLPAKTENLKLLPYLYTVYTKFYYGVIFVLIKFWFC